MYTVGLSLDAKRVDAVNFVSLVGVLTDQHLAPKVTTTNMEAVVAVSYTHLTLPTNREV